jgi:hypothetical protein
MYLSGNRNVICVRNEENINADWFKSITITIKILAWNRYIINAFNNKKNIMMINI